MSRQAFVGWFCRNIAFLSIAPKRYGGWWELWLHFPFYTVQILSKPNRGVAVSAHINSGLCGAWYRKRTLRRLNARFNGGTA